MLFETEQDVEDLEFVVVVVLRDGTGCRGFVVVAVVGWIGCSGFVVAVVRGRRGFVDGVGGTRGVVVGIRGVGVRPRTKKKILFF